MPSSSWVALANWISAKVLIWLKAMMSSRPAGTAVHSSSSLCEPWENTALSWRLAEYFQVNRTRPPMVMTNITATMTAIR